MDTAQIRCGIKECPEEALAMAKFCWDHLPDKVAYSAMLAAEAGAGGSLAGSNLKKVVLRGAHIEKAVLDKANLAQADLSGTRFFDCSLKGADMIGADLSGCDFTHCSMEGADITRGRLSGSRLWNSRLSGSNLTECDLSNTDLWNANLFNVRLWRTNLAGSRSLKKASFSGGTGRFDRIGINEEGALSAEESYMDLKNYFMSNGMYNDASWASFKEKSMERLVLKKKGDWTYIPSLMMNILCGYGEKPYRIVLSAIATITMFATLYHAFGAVERPCDPSYIMRWYDYLYYSVITFTTVGYGDFVPKSSGLFRLLAAAECFCGVFVTGLFIFTLARKYSAR